jgi:hypothetical protein
VVFNGALLNVEIISARIREEYGRWHLARLFRSLSFGFAELVPWMAGE